MPETMGQGNPDAAQDESLIHAVIQRELGPIFEAIGVRLRDLDEDLGETRDLLYKFSEGLIGAADNHKRTMLTDKLSSSYGKDMEPFEGFYKDTQGKGFMDSILEELMGDGAPGDEELDGWMQNKLNDAKGKYGKYVGLQAEAPGAPPVSVEEKSEGELPPEAMEAGGEMPAEAGPEEEADPVMKIMKKMTSVQGEKHKLSSKK